MEIKLSKYIIKINDKPIDDEWYRDIFDVNVELNESSLDNASIDISLKSSSNEGTVFGEEGDYIDIYIYDDDKVTGRENVFSGIIKTVLPVFGNQTSVKIEAFEELFLLDFSDESLEVNASKGEGLSFDKIVETGEDFIEDVSDSLPDWLTKFLGIEKKPKSSTVTSFLKSLQKKYPATIKEIVAKDVDVSFETKSIHGNGQTDYQRLVALARQFNRTVFMKKGILYFINKYELLKNPFIYQPSIYQYNQSYSNYYLKSFKARTTLKNLTENLKIYSQTNNEIGEGTKEVKVSGKELKADVIKIEINLDNLEKEKAIRKKQYEDSIGTDSEDYYYNRFNSFMNHYYETKDQQQNEIKKLTEDFEKNRMYSYDILKKLNNGETFRVASTNSKDAKEAGKEMLYNSESNFVECDLELMYGNNILRPYQVLTVLLFNSGGMSKGYARRFSGTYDIKKVNFKINSSGFATSISGYRNYLIGQSNG